MLTESFPKDSTTLDHHYNLHPITLLRGLDHLPLDNPLRLTHCYCYNPTTIVINPHWAHSRRCKNQNPFIHQYPYLIDY